MLADDFIPQAWRDHAEAPESVAERLQAAWSQIDDAARLAPFARLVTHVLGEHLGRWDDGLALLDQLSALPVAALDEAATARRALVREQATLTLAGGRPLAEPLADVEEHAAVQALLSAVHSGRHDVAAAEQALDAALALTAAVQQPPAPGGSCAWRPLAIAANNLACELLDHPPRSPAGDATMVRAAALAVQYWRLAGTWLETERAHWRLSTCRLAAGDAPGAVAAAQDCLDLCAAQDRPDTEMALEFFYGHHQQALAQRAAGQSQDAARSAEQARSWFDRMEAGTRDACRGDLAALPP